MTVETREPMTAEDRIEMLDELGDMEGVAAIDDVLGGILLGPGEDTAVHLELIAELEESAT